MTTTTERAEARTPLLNQVIAVRAGVKNDTQLSLTKHYRLLGNKNLLSGMARTYAPKDDDDFRYPPENTNPQVSAEKVLRDIAGEMSHLFDITAALDWTNQHARADVVLFTSTDPVVLLRDVPVTYLLFLEKKLVDIETIVRNLPTLDPAETWTFDPATDLWKSAPVGTVKTKKLRRNHVLAAATDRHPAQVESYTEDEPIGTWTTVKMSGALPAQRINVMLSRVKALLGAVKFAREQANMEDVVDPRPGRVVFEYLFAAE